MVNEVYIRNFGLYYPALAKRAVSYANIGRFRLLVELDDGTRGEYSELSNTFKTFVPFDGSEESWKREFRHRLVTLMDEYPHDQTSLAEASGISQQSISNYMWGKTIPSGYAIAKLAKALNCSVSDLTDF